jgi:GntR family transcriptional regulator of vanillate catabolism
MGLQQTVLLHLRELILRGEFEPGQRLAEQQLAEQLGASRTPVRAALGTLEQEGLVKTNETGGFVVRQFTPREVADAIAVRGHLEGMAARLVAEHGLNRQLALILEACGNHALQRAMAANDKLPFAPASAMLPMQGEVAIDRDWMLYAHRQHHMLVDAFRRHEGARAQSLAVEHTEVAQMNMRLALERRSESERVMPAIRLISGG